MLVSAVCPLAFARTALDVAWSVSAPARPASADTFELALPASLAGVLGHPQGYTFVVRLAGVDALQRGQLCGLAPARWACGEAARAWLLAVLGTEPVTCVPSLPPRLRPALVYGRSPRDDSTADLEAAQPVAAFAARCASARIGDLAAAIVAAGWAYPHPGAFAVALRSAQRARAGLWRVGASAPGVVAPWAWLAHARVALARARVGLAVDRPRSGADLAGVLERAIAADPLSRAEAARLTR